MAHEHHHHHHSAPVTNVTGAFVFGIALNLAYVIIQVVIGLYTHSLAILSDAGHNFADVGALAISLLAFRLLKVRATKSYTYGYRKTSILTALFNAMVLLVSIGAILYEAAHRFFNPEPIPGLTIAIVAGVGVVINFASALLFFRDKDKDINIKSAYLHLMSDAAVSIGLVAGGIVIYYTHWYWVDSVLSVVVAAVIVVSTWQLLKESIRLSLDGVPNGINLDDIRTLAMKIKGIKSIHHIHVWAISTTENALTAHIVFPSNISSEEEHKIKHHLRHELEHKNIQHITLETEREDEQCEAVNC